MSSKTAEKNRKKHANKRDNRAKTDRNLREWALKLDDDGYVHITGDLFVGDILQQKSYTTQPLHWIQVDSALTMLDKRYFRLGNPQHGVLPYHVLESMKSSKRVYLIDGLYGEKNCNNQFGHVQMCSAQSANEIYHGYVINRMW